MFLPGWSESFGNFQEEIRFEVAPLWLRALSRTIYFERFAYPIALKRGLGFLWPIGATPTFETPPSPHWKIMNSVKVEEDLFFEGSLARLTHGRTPRRRRVNKLVEFFSHGRFELKEGFGLTRAGRTLKLRNSVHSENGTMQPYKAALALRRNP